LVPNTDTRLICHTAHPEWILYITTIQKFHDPYFNSKLFKNVLDSIYIRMFLSRTKGLLYYQQADYSSTWMWTQSTALRTSWKMDLKDINSSPHFTPVFSLKN
jgi:hypothetical protein